MTAFGDVVDFAKAHESTWDREASGKFGAHLKEAPPWNRLRGPIHSRGPASGVICQRGKELVAWGEPDRADLTYSIVKTYLALLAGVAFDRGLIRDVDERIGDRLKGIGFEDPHNAPVTWRHMLQQTSEWEGTLWGIPDQVDRYNTASFGPASTGHKGDARPLQAPGTHWEYNDIRINQLALALLHLFRSPLPEVFRTAIARPVGATENWKWLGYDDAWVTIDGKKMQSVTGGSHWGGGMSISARDQAKIGRMMLDGGVAGGQRVLSAEWLRQMVQPSDVAPFYGYLTWLNRDHALFPSVPEFSYFSLGAGSSFVWMEPERQLVVVIRWIEKQNADELFARILRAIDLG